MKARIWDSDSESDDEVDSAHICFMVQGDDPLEINSESHFDDISMDELGEAVEQLSNNYDILKNKYLKLKKENEVL